MRYVYYIDINLELERAIGCKAIYIVVMFLLVAIVPYNLLDTKRMK